MKLWYRDDGTILKLTDDDAEGSENFITLAGNKIPDDIRTIFALGKYRIKNNKISKKANFKIKAKPSDDHPLKEMVDIYLEHPPSDPE
ncbi:MAG: hypothetical protein GY703_12145 [Gammaproteobacteria bacterium]|nr:hypothetical protein [Gammaproteobacteria bacterium]